MQPKLAVPSNVTEAGIDGKRRSIITDWGVT